MEGGERCGFRSAGASLLPRILRRLPTAASAVVCSVAAERLLMNRRDPRAHEEDQALAIIEAYGGRIHQLMGRLQRLRQRLHDPGCEPCHQAALQARMAWLHAAIFAISGEIDCGY